MADLSLDPQNIIAVLGIQKLPDEQKLKVVEQVSELVQKRLLARVLESLNPEKKEEFLVLLQGQNQQALNEFLDQEAPDFLAWLEEETAKVKTEFADWPANLEL